MHLEIGDTSTPANRLATVLAEGLGPDHPALADLAAVVLDRSKDDEIARLRAEVEALRASRGELLALLEGWAYHGWNREREERSRALVDVASAKAEGGSNG
jgi:hypothetical protein